MFLAEAGCTDMIIGGDLAEMLVAKVGAWWV